MIEFISYVIEGHKTFIIGKKLFISILENKNNEIRFKGISK